MIQYNNLAGYRLLYDIGLSFSKNSLPNFPGGHRTPNRRGRGISESAGAVGGMGKRDNECFGSGFDQSNINEEFDFEKNLALFDKV